MLQMTITLEGLDDGDIETSLEEVLRLVRQGFTSGGNNSDTSAFHFNTTVIDTPTLAWIPSERDDYERQD